MPSPETLTQISAYISDDTSEELEAYVSARGLKKGFVIEQALRHHLRALRELPADAIVPPVLVVDRAVGQRLIGRTRRPRRPTAAMRALAARKK